MPPPSWRAGLTTPAVVEKTTWAVVSGLPSAVTTMARTGTWRRPSEGMAAAAGNIAMRRASGIFRSRGSSVTLPSGVICTRVAFDAPGGTMMGTVARPIASAAIGPNSRPPTFRMTRAPGATVTGYSALPTSGTASAA
jgi:hypothetical protein